MPRSPRRSRTSPTAPSGTGQPWQDPGPTRRSRGTSTQQRSGPGFEAGVTSPSPRTNGRRSSPATGPSGHSVSSAPERAFELGRPAESERLLRAALQLGLPPQERALAAFEVESLEPTWSGAATVESFVRIAQELAEAGHEDQALRTLNAISLRAHWENLDGVTRRGFAEIAGQLAGEPDDPVRLATLGLFDPVGQGAN